MTTKGWIITIVSLIVIASITKSYLQTQNYEVYER